MNRRYFVSAQTEHGPTDQAFEDDREMALLFYAVCVGRGWLDVSFECERDGQRVKLAPPSEYLTRFIPSQKVSAQ